MVLIPFGSAQRVNFASVPSCLEFVFEFLADEGDSSS